MDAWDGLRLSTKGFEPSGPILSHSEPHLFSSDTLLAPMLESQGPQLVQHNYETVQATPQGAWTVSPSSNNGPEPHGPLGLILQHPASPTDFNFSSFTPSALQHLLSTPQECYHGSVSPQNDLAGRFSLSAPPSGSPQATEPSPSSPTPPLCPTHSLQHSS